jgi:hypothetical protein
MAEATSSPRCVRCDAVFQYTNSQPNLCMCLGCCRSFICIDKCALRVSVVARGAPTQQPDRTVELLVCSEACANVVRAQVQNNARLSLHALKD